MALYWQNNYLNTFDKVAACYESIKPLVSKHHTLADDLRPIGDRNRKWERIKKINNNCYLLMDGYYSGDDVFSAWYSGGNTGKPTEAEMINLAPIVWRRHRDGTTTIKVRNGTGQGAHNGRYSFLDRHLPNSMRFIIRNGKHFVSLYGAEYYLAKSKTAAKCALPKSEHKNRWNSYLTARNDGVALTFRVDDDKISFVDGGKKLPVPPKIRVDKKAKTKMKDAIAEFREWAFTMYPLLPVKDREYAGRMYKEVREFMGGAHSYGGGMASKFQCNPEITRKIICDPDHELRLHLMYALMRETDYHLERIYNTPEEHVQKVRAQFNRHINKLCGFVKAVRG